MKIIVDSYLPAFLKDRDYGPLVDGRENFFYKNKVDLKTFEDDDIHVINWGENLHGYPHSVLETGFFWDAVHLDRHGLYTFCSFNFNRARDIVEKYAAKVPCQVLMERGLLQSKLRQPPQTINWNGVVLVCQHPTDRSVLKGGRTVDYRKFIENACKYYGKNLFLKIHPVNSKEEESWIRSIADKYGASVGRVNLSIIDNAEFVLVYNSTFVVDCLLRGKPVVHYALGYFWNCGAVDYTSYTLPSKCNQHDMAYGYKLCDFLIWKYCFHRKDSMDNWATIFKTFAGSDDFFPLPAELSYGAYITSEH